MRRTPLTRTCARAPALQCEKLTRRGRLLEALTTLTGSFRQPTSDPRMRVAKTIHVTSAQLTKTALLPCSLSCAARKTCAFVKIRMSRGARSCRITVEFLSCRTAVELSVGLLGGKSVGVCIRALVGLLAAVRRRREGVHAAIANTAVARRLALCPVPSLPSSLNGYTV